MATELTEEQRETIILGDEINRLATAPMPHKDCIPLGTWVFQTDAEFDDLWLETVKELKMIRLEESIAAWLIRRLTSVVRLATKLVGLIPEVDNG